MEFVSWRHVDFTNPGEPYCAESVLVACNPGVDDSAVWQTINTYQITELTRATCGDAFTGSLFTPNCQEMVAAGLGILAGYDPVTGFYFVTAGFADVAGVGPGVYPGGGYVAAGCDSGFLTGTVGKITIS